ncbi:N-formylglutamate amidohydrolase [Geminicoccaceae bacterium 1502E]|nr:N-formylglutamate amidohydrolase [Geminicoccaceae bacterium 1502E]
MLSIRLVAVMALQGKNVHVPPFREMPPPAPAGPIVLSSPHSGTHYPRVLLEALRVRPARLRLLEDGPIDRLAEEGGAAGATLLAATYARAFIDLNRSACELDPELLGGEVDGLAVRLTTKVRAGLGVVPSRLGTEPIYARPLRPMEMRARLEHAWQPYHRRLSELLAARRAEHGVALLLDCHSMPADPVAVRAGRQVDVALGDRFGRSCHGAIVETARIALEAAGLCVARNRPYAGGFITEHYGRPAGGVHALQLELRRSLFMDESSGEPHGDFAALQRVLGRLVTVLGERLAAGLPGDAA